MMHGTKYKDLRDKERTVDLYHGSEYWIKISEYDSKRYNLPFVLTFQHWLHFHGCIFLHSIFICNQDAENMPLDLYYRADIRTRTKPTTVKDEDF